MYNVGDVVRVRPDLEKGGLYGGFLAVDVMQRLAGKNVTIVSKHHFLDEVYYKVRECRYNFTNEMFLLLSEPELPLDDSEFDLSEVIM